MRFKLLGTIGIVLGLMLVASVALAAFPDQGVGRGNTTTWVMNVHQTLDAKVVATYIDRSGYPSSNVAETISPQGNASFPAQSAGLNSGWLGSALIDSLRPLASVAETVWQDVPKDDGWTGAAYYDFPQGANEIFFPAVSKTKHQKAIVTIQCVDRVDCQVSMSYRTRDGDVVTGSPFLDTIEAFSQETYDLWDPSLNPNIPDQANTPAPWFGSLQVTSSQEIAGVQVTHFRQGYAAAHNSLVPGSDTEIYYPSVNRRKWNDWTGNSDWSALTVQNLNPFTITAYLNFYDRDGNRELYFPDDIPPYSSHAYNTRYGGSVDPTVFEPLANRFLGSAIVTSTHPFLGTCTLVRGPKKLAASYNGVSGGASTVVFPVAYRTKNGSTWTGYTGVIVLNLDPENEITIHTQWLTNGSPTVTFTDTIPPNTPRGYNTRYGDHATTLADLGDDWSGTVIVTTTNPAGIGGLVNNTIKGSDYMYTMQYNGLPVD